MDPRISPTPPPPCWKSSLRADAARVCSAHRWGRALVVVGWIHLAAFLACQAIVNPAVRSDPRHLGLWIGDFLASLIAIRWIAGMGWHRASPAAVLVTRVWGTFLILAFNLAMLNVLTGFSHDWFKPPWATLSTFGFAMMAWLFDVRFLIPAVQMYFTGLLMIFYPSWNFLIFGVSWWAALQGVGWRLGRMARDGER